MRLYGPSTLIICTIPALLCTASPSFLYYPYYVLSCTTVPSETSQPYSVLHHSSICTLPTMRCVASQYRLNDSIHALCRTIVPSTVYPYHLRSTTVPSILSLPCSMPQHVTICTIPAMLRLHEYRPHPSYHDDTSCAVSPWDMQKNIGSYISLCSPHYNQYNGSSQSLTICIITFDKSFLYGLARSLKYILWLR
jgi:hypothetical protein